MRLCSSLGLIAQAMTGASGRLRPLAAASFAFPGNSRLFFPRFHGRLLHPLGGYAMHASSCPGVGRAGLVLWAGT